MDIGEDMGEKLNLDSVVEDLSGALYEDINHLAMGRPLDFGRTVFVRLHRAVHDLDGVKNVHVAWDHYSNVIIAAVEMHDGCLIRYEMRKHEIEHIAQKQAYIQQSVEAIKKAVEEHSRG